MYDQLFGRNKPSKASETMLMGSVENQEQLMATFDGQLGSQGFNFEKMFEMPLSQSNNLKLDDFNQDVDMSGLENELSLITTNHTLVSQNNAQTQERNAFGGYTDLFQNDGESIVAPQNRHSSEANLSEFLTSDNFFRDANWDFRMGQPGNVNSYYGDSTTLGSESRASNEFFHDSPSQIEGLQDEHESKRSRFSNTLSSIFRNRDKEKHNLRGINPLSTHKDPQQVLTDSLPTVAEVAIVEAEAEDQEAKKCSKSLHSKNCDCTPKKRSTANSILTSLANARLGFNSRQAKKSPLQESVIKEEEFEDSLYDLPPQPAPDMSLVDFDEELTRAISLASKNNSNYNFNNDLPSVEPRLSSSSLQQETPEEPSDVDGTDLDHDVEVKEEENHSPDYGALFADMNASKKKSKTLSFRKKLEEAKVTKRPPYPSLDDETIEVVPMKESTRGRKPSLEYDATKTFVCTYCSRRFRRQEHLKRHFRSLHTNEKPFDCHLCGKKFSRSDNLTQHIKTHTDVADFVEAE